MTKSIILLLVPRLLAIRYLALKPENHEIVCCANPSYLLSIFSQVERRGHMGAVDLGHRLEDLFSLLISSLWHQPSRALGYEPDQTRTTLKCNKINPNFALKLKYRETAFVHHIWCQVLTIAQTMTEQPPYSVQDCENSRNCGQTIDCLAGNTLIERIHECVDLICII